MYEAAGNYNGYFTMDDDPQWPGYEAGDTHQEYCDFNTYSGKPPLCALLQPERAHSPFPRPRPQHT